MFEKKSTLIAAALSAAFALPLAAQAQTSVTVYGKLYPEINHVSITGASPAGADGSTLTRGAGTASASATTMDSPNSRLGFRGSEDLGGNLKAIFQLEMGFQTDTGAGDSTLFSRNTFLGMSGDFGTIRLGNMDTVYKELGDTLPFLGITSGNFMAISNILSKPTIGGSASAGSFHLRRTNSIYYTSPEFSGVQALVDYSLGEAANGVTAKGSVLSTGLKYESGPIYAALAYEMHKDMFGASTSLAGTSAGNANQPTLANVTSTGTAINGATSKDDAMRGTFQYRFRPDLRAEVNLAHLRYNESGGAIGKFSNFQQTTWSISGQKDFGAVSLVAAYAQASSGSCSLVGGASCSTSNMGAKMLNLGAGYNFSKRTLLFAVYSTLRNDSAALDTNWQNGKMTAGQDSSIMSIGMSHSF
ncbi:MAG: hypothetical protein JWP38_3584 [Herbaspirillum sp.]|nr:hypothetical protein [Herbaspirillum sp.]